MPELVKTYWFLMWRLVLSMPYWLKIFLECFALWLLLGLGLTIVAVGLRVLIIPLLKIVLTNMIMGLQFLITLPAKRNPDSTESIMELDDKLSSFGIGILNSKEKSIERLKKWKLRKFLFNKKYLWWFTGGCVFLIIPFYIRSALNEPYSTAISVVCEQHNKLEQKMTKGIEAYPDPFAKPESKQVMASKAASEAAKEVRVELNQKGKGGAYIRDNPGVDGTNVLETVSGAADVFYLGESIRVENGRVWIKVRTKKTDEGWLSTALVKEECLEEWGIK